MAAEKLRDFSQPIDVPLLDATVDAFYGTGSKEQVYLRFHFRIYSAFCSISLINYLVYFTHQFGLVQSESCFRFITIWCFPMFDNRDKLRKF